MDVTEERSVDRHGLEVLPPEECWELVAQTAVGRVAFVDGGESLVFPVTHGVHEHRVVFRTGRGSKLDAAQMNEIVAFEVDDWDPVEHTGWSVLVRGVVETVYEYHEIEQYEALGTGPWLDSAAQGTWVRILPQEISGRRLPG